MNFAPPRIEEIANIDIRLEQRPWPFAIDRAREIDEHWTEQLKSKPHHYNGRVLLMHRLAVVTTAAGHRLEGGCFIAEYKAFLAWRDFGFPDRTINNVFAMAALRSSDGAFLLGEMGRSTASAGQIYFPAGTPEPDDLVGETVDFQGSVLRELEEETGIAADEIALVPGWSVVFQGSRVACMKRIDSALSAAELVTRAAAFIAREKRPELAGLKAAFGVEDFDKKRMPDFIQTYLRHVFAKKA